MTGKDHGGGKGAAAAAGGGGALAPEARLTGKVELKINLEALTRCGGGCMGCVMSAEERRAGGLMSEGELDRAEAFISRFIAEHSARHAAITEISLNLGQGDYFLIPTARIEPLVAWMRRVGGGRAQAFVTAALVGSHQRIREAALRFYDAALAHEQVLLVDMVFDPCKTSLARFRDTYARNIGLLRELFGGVDLNINIGPDTVASLTPEALHGFIRDNGFDIGTLNLAPTPGSAAALARDWPAIMGWITRFVELWEPDSHAINVTPVLARAISAAADESGGPLAMTRDRIADMLCHEIYIDRQGRIGHTQAGIGDAPLGPRTGFAPVGHVDEVFPQGVLAALAPRARALATQLAAPFQRRPACAACRFNRACPGAGMGTLDTALAGQAVGDASCPLGIKPVMEAVEATMQSGRDLGCLAYSAQRPRVQAGFASGRFPDATELTPWRGGPPRFPEIPAQGRERS